MKSNWACWRAKTGRPWHWQEARTDTQTAEVRQKLGKISLKERGQQIVSRAIKNTEGLPTFLTLLMHLNVHI